MPTRELDPVTQLSAGAVGEPGHRAFYLQATSGPERVTVLVEKEQVRSLAERLETWLPRLAAERPEDETETSAAPAVVTDLVPPEEPAFRAGQLALTYDPERDRVMVLVRELVTELLDQAGEPAGEEPTDPWEVRIWVTRPQLRLLARRAAEVVARGRPLCPLCANPLDPSGHVCAALNGHRPAAS